MLPTFLLQQFVSIANKKAFFIFQIISQLTSLWKTYTSEK